MAKDHGCCCCALVLLFSLVAVVVVAVVLGLKFGRPLSDSAKVTLVNATTAVSSNSNSNTTMTTLIPPITPTRKVDSTQVTLVSTSTKMLTTRSMMSTAESLTTPSDDEDCGSRNSSCVKCIGNVKCYYCHNDNTCRLYPASAVLPTAECPLSQVRWGATCDVSFEVLVIAVSVVGAVIVLALCCCCCCCYCRKSQNGSCGLLRCCSCRSCCRSSGCGRRRCCSCRSCCRGTSSGSGRHTWRDFKWSRDNRSNQMNPNNWRYWKARESV